MVAGSNPDEVTGFYFYNLPNPSSRTMALGLTQPLTDMSIRDIPGEESTADKLTAISVPIVQKNVRCDMSFRNVEMFPKYTTLQLITSVFLLYVLCPIQRDPDLWKTFLWSR
jgi:hypothetical protein